MSYIPKRKRVVFVFAGYVISLIGITITLTNNLGNGDSTNIEYWVGAAIGLTGAIILGRNLRHLK